MRFWFLQGLSHDVRDDEARYEEKISRNGIPHTGLATVRSSLYLDCVGGRDAGVYTCVADTPFERITKSSTVAIGKTNHTIIFQITVCVCLF